VEQLLGLLERIPGTRELADQRDLPPGQRAVAIQVFDQLDL
jgi:hypothetical protein